MTPEDMQQDQQRSDAGARPVPDPTVLTTEALQREIAMLKELTTARLDHVQDKSAERSQEIHDRLGREEQHRLENKVETQRAVDAALDAQRQAAAKTEIAFDKQLAEIKANLRTEVEGLRRELADLKDRIGRVEFGPPPSSG